MIFAGCTVPVFICQWQVSRAAECCYESNLCNLWISRLPKSIHRLHRERNYTLLNGPATSSGGRMNFSRGCKRTSYVTSRRLPRSLCDDSRFATIQICGHFKLEVCKDREQHAQRPQPP